MQKIGGLLREAGIERRGFQELRCGVGGGLRARYGRGLFAKIAEKRGWEGKCGVSTWNGACLFSIDTWSNSRGKMGWRDNQGTFLRCLLGLFSIGQGTADIQGALHEKSLFVRGLFLFWRGSIPSWPVRSSRQWFEKRK